MRSLPIRVQRIGVEVGRTAIGLVAVAAGDHADLAVGLEEDIERLIGGQQLVLAERDRELAIADPFLAQVGVQDPAVVDEERRLAVEGVADRSPAIRRSVEHQVQDEDHQRGEQPGQERRVLADHRVLDRVGDHQQDDEVEGRQLARLALAEEPEADHETDVDDRGPDHDREQVGAEIGDRHAAMLADRSSGYHRPVPATTALRAAPERAMRGSLLWLSRRRSLGRLATRIPLTRSMVARFVAGETLDEAIVALQKLHAAGFRTTVDVLGEAVASIDAAATAADEYLATLDALAEHALDRNVSLKLSQLGLKLDPGRCRENLARILRRAADIGAFIRIDMEDHSTTDATLAVWRELRPINAGLGDSGVVIQAALRRSPHDVDALIDEQARIRLCKGAYVEPASVAYPDKADVDAAYETLMIRLLRDGAFPAIATHDERLIAKAVALVREEGIAPDRFEFQMLFGVRRDLQERLLRAGYGVRVYVPFGTQWYPYFMRRLAERPANVAFVFRSLLRERRDRGASGSTD